MNIIGHEHIRNHLQKALDADACAHAYIFAGPQHVGKTVVLEWFISQVLGETVSTIDLTKKRNQAYPDFHYIEREEGKKDIGIDQIREMTNALKLSSFSNNYKIAVVQDAHFLNESSSNALLKTLEEPTKKTILFLLTDNEDRILPTIRSRSTFIRFDLVPIDVLRMYVKSRGEGLSREEQEQMVRMSQGRVGLLHTYLHNKEEFDILQKRIAKVVQTLQSSVVERFTYIAEQEGYEILIDDIERVFHDCLAIKTNRSGNVILFSHLEEIQKLAEKLSFDQLQSLVRQILELKKAQSYNVNQQLYLENIFAII